MPQTAFCQDSAEVKTALVLSGGGARGFAHIGVIKALEEIGFYPDLIVGTSMGALIGALYAAGKTPEEIQSYAEETNWLKLFSYQSYREIEFISQKMVELPAIFSLRFDDRFNVIFPKNLLSTQGITERVTQATIYPDFATGGDFDSLVIPFRAMATDIRTGKSIILKSGNLAKAITASSSYPFILAPVSIDSFLLIDGGLTNNVPCDVAKDLGANFIVAVDVSSKIIRLGDEIDPFSLWGQAVNTISFFSDTRNLHLADVLIHPEIGEISSTDFDSIQTLIDRGYEQTKLLAEKISLYANHRKPSAEHINQMISLTDSLFIRSIDFTPNLLTNKMVINREVVLNEGDRWNLNLARRSVKNLYSTGLFKNVYISLTQAGGDSADLKFDIEEEQRTQFSFGARYDSERETRGFASMKYKNLFGVGIDNLFYLIASDQFQRLAWDFRIPRIWMTTLTGYLSLYTQEETIPLYRNMKRTSFGEFTKTGIEFNSGIQVKRVGLTSVAFQYESTNVESDSGYRPIISKTNYQTGSLLVRILVENTDDIDLPTRGRINKVLFQHSFNKNELLLFDRISVESSAFETFNEKYTFTTNLQFGYLTSALSIFEKFRLGGSESLPGYHQDELWGRLILSFGIGFRAPLTSGIYYQIAGKFGNVWEDIQYFNWRELRSGFKAGLLIPTPVGPISLDYGFDLHGRSLAYLSIGHYF